MLSPTIAVNAYTPESRAGTIGCIAPAHSSTLKDYVAPHHGITQFALGGDSLHAEPESRILAGVEILIRGHIPPGVAITREGGFPFLVRLQR